ncbi:MAG: type VI secretion system protein TssA [Acetobacteraceae bacterium]
MAGSVLDLDTLLAALPDGDGAGVDLREDWSPGSPYQKLRDARSEARVEERQRDAEGETDLPPADAWRTVRQVAEQAIGSRSKDFEIAAWLAEAMLRLEGLPGLTDSSKLLAGLLEQYWDTGFPRPDEDGFEGRIAPLGGLSGGDFDGTLVQPLRRAPLFRRQDGTMLALYMYEQAVEVAGLADSTKKESRWAAGVPRLEQLEAEARLDVNRLRGTARAARAAREAWAEFEAQLDARLGRDAPSTRRVSEVLERLANVADQLAGGPEEGAAAEAGGVVAAEGAAAAGAGGGGGGLSVAGAIANREEALRQLERIAEFFRKTEPHSPLAYTLTDAARRGRMPLPELLAEVLGDETARTAMLTALGIRPQNPDEQRY